MQQSHGLFAIAKLLVVTGNKLLVVLLSLKVLVAVLAVAVIEVYHHHRASEAPMDSCERHTLEVS